jgi:hypothetical protein
MVISLLHVSFFFLVSNGFSLPLPLFTFSSHANLFVLFFVVVVIMSKNKTLLKFLCFRCIVEVFVASSLPMFLSYCDCWDFCYIVITIVSLKLYLFFPFLLRFMLHCWAFYCSLLLQNVGIVMVVIAMVIVSKVFVFFFFFNHFFFSCFASIFKLYHQVFCYKFL